MLGLSDVLELPAGVEAREGRLADDVRGVSVPMNPAARIVVAGAGRTLADIAEDIVAAFALPQAQARDDVLAFVWQLNRLGLANVRRQDGLLAALVAWLATALRLLPAGTLPPLAARRVPLDTSHPARAALGVVRGLLSRSLGLGLLTTLAVVPAASVLGSALLALSLGLGAAAALVVHEASHAVALAGASSAALIVGGRRISVVHAPIPSVRAQLVAAAGPLVPGLAGLAVAAVAAAAAMPALASAALPLAGHAIGLLAFTRDGRRACGI